MPEEAKPKHIGFATAIAAALRAWGQPFDRVTVRDYHLTLRRSYVGPEYEVLGAALPMPALVAISSAVPKLDWLEVHWVWQCAVGNLPASHLLEVRLEYLYGQPVLPEGRA